MIKVLPGCLLLCLSTSLFSSLTQAQIPGHASGLEPELSLRLFYRAKPLNFMFENEVRLQQQSRKYRKHLLGAYWRVLEGLKLGAFVQAEYGILHDDDWLVSSWDSTNGRGEISYLVDVTPRFKLPHDTVFEFKTRYQHNTFNNHNTLRLRPGLTWFYFETEGHRDLPVWTVFSQLEIYLPLNYNQPGSIYEFWVYLGALRYLDERMQIGAHAAFRQARWRTSQAYAQAFPSQVYDRRDSGFVLGLDFIYRWGSLD